ncbi:MAG: hypothetical protein ACLFQU_06740 [Candidatus Kapaibacterium sp.]
MSGYISKDYIHEGCGLPCRPDEVFEKIPYSVKKNISKAERNKIKIEKVQGNKDDIDILRKMWYDPEDPNMPGTLSNEEHMFIAYNDKNVPLGACILLPVGNHLFLNNLAGNKEGKKLRVQDYLLWHCVNYFAESRFKYIDVGVSYRPSLYRFFEKWKVFSYPVIFNKPALMPIIRMNPFQESDLTYERDKPKAKKCMKKLKEISGTDKITFFPNAYFAEKALKMNGLEYEDSTFSFPEVNAESYIDLTKIFPVQFGALAFGIAISDEDMWNKYSCLDLFKRELTFTAICNELDKIDVIRAKRQNNYNYLKKYFFIDDIEPEPDSAILKYTFRFRHNENHRYHEKLKEFFVEHSYDENENIIGLPVHQNLGKAELDYLYGIFRGVLNLCSEWEHTNKYGNFKS